MEVFLPEASVTHASGQIITPSNRKSTIFFSFHLAFLLSLGLECIMEISASRTRARQYVGAKISYTSVAYNRDRRIGGSLSEGDLTLMTKY